MDYLFVTVRIQRGVLVVGAAGLLVVGAAVAGVIWVRHAQSDPQPTTVVLQAAGDEGADPFVPVASGRPVAVSRPHLPDSGSAAAVTATVDPDTGVRTVAGNTEHLYAAGVRGNQELYGGSGSLSACDPAAIADFLAAHPDKAGAWAGVRGIDPGEIAGYLNTLTPVLLLHDTVVTNHGFAGGVATPLVSVLQAGTAVLVDPTGLPVVRCACGNPLSAPPAVDLSTAGLDGTRWDGFDPNQAVVVTGGATVTEFVVVDVASGQDLTLSVGPPPAVSSSGSAPSTASIPSTAATTPAVDGGTCVLDLTWPDAAPGWIEPLDSGFTCQQMIDQWRRNEQWPGERGGTLMVVDFGDGWYCTGVHWDATRPRTNAVGDCDLNGRRFNVYQGPAGVQTTVPTDATTDATAAGPPDTSSGVAGATVTSDVFVTPSQNIRCADLDNAFACTIKDYDFTIGPCENEHAPFVTLGSTGPARLSPCIGDFFSGVSHWPDPTPYGTTVRAGDISCDVEQTGVTCTNPDGHGFTLARAAFTPF